jgi:hypothetical protein
MRKGGASVDTLGGKQKITIYKLNAFKILFKNKSLEYNINK